MRYVIDTNIWIAFFRKDPKVQPRLLATLRQGHDIYVIPIVYYEFIRGFRYTNNLQMLHTAVQFWSTLPYYEATKAIWDEATQLWVMTKRLNKMPGDKDLFIAAFAIHLDATVVTRNEKHFTVFSFPIENWVDD
jgi:predicted nucleic acid-binding protein